MTVDANRVSACRQCGQFPKPPVQRLGLTGAPWQVSCSCGCASCYAESAGQAVDAWNALRRSPSLSGGEGEVVAWECVDANGDVHITRSRAEMETWDQTDVFVRPLYTHPKEAEVTVTEEMVERAARAMEPMAFREEFTATDEWFELEQEGRAQALGRARAALVAALSRKG